MRRWVGLLLGIGVCAAVGAEPTYTNSDIESMKVRYEPKRRVSSKMLNDLGERPFKTPNYVQWFLPYQSWENEYQNYFYRHYHDRNLTFKPSLICMHYTVISDSQSVYNSFLKGTNMCAGDSGTAFGHVSVQLMIDKDGTVFQLLPLDRRCTGAYGVNHKAISIEMVAANESDLLSRPQQIHSSFCVVRDLMKKFNIPASGIIAHSEVSAGKSVVPEYLDYADSVYPDRYPASSHRSDPGSTYMSWLRGYLKGLPNNN